MENKYNKSTSSVESIIKDSKQNLKNWKSKPSISGAWDCYCEVYADEKRIGETNCLNIEDNIRTAFSQAVKTVIVDIRCVTGMKPPTPEPNGPMGMY